MMSSVRAGWRALLATAAISASAGCSWSESKPAAAWTSPHVTPPAIADIDDTVWVQLHLADSFDIHPDGTCAGSDDNRGMKDQAWVLLYGDSTGLCDQTKASALFKHDPPVIYRGKRLLDDDHQYRVIDAVFTPLDARPRRLRDQVRLAHHASSRSAGPVAPPFGHPDRPGYGRLVVRMQTCPSLLAPPDKECPEWGN